MLSGKGSGNPLPERCPEQVSALKMRWRLLPPGQRLCRTIGIAVSLMAATATTAHADCLPTPDRKILSAVMNLNFTAARQYASSSHIDRMLIKSPRYYEGFIAWAEANSARDARREQRAIAVTRDAIADLYNAGENTAAVVAALTLARAMIVSDQPLSAYLFAKPYLADLQHLRNDNLPDRQRAAVDYLYGLLHIYTANQSEKSADWLGFPVGDLQTGRQLVEHAVSSSMDFADDALRALLSEAHWENSISCRYQPLAALARQRFANNVMFRLLHQKLLLRCGLVTAKPHQAHEFRVNPRSLQTARGWPNLPDMDTRLILERQYLRYLAQTIQVDELHHYQPLITGNRPYRRYALANALDLAGDRDKARSLYQALENSSSEVIARRAKVRQKHPYEHSPQNPANAEVLPAKRRLMLDPCY